MIVPGRYRRLRCGNVTTATAALRTVGSVGRVTEKGRDLKFVAIGQSGSRRLFRQADAPIAPSVRVT